MMRRILLQAHLLIGLVAGAILVVLGVTGAALVFEQEIDAALYPRLRRVFPEERRASLDDIARVVRRDYPDDPIVRITFATRPDESFEVSLRSGLSVFVDPYTPRVLGDRGHNHFVEHLLDLHLRLMAGPPGNLVVASATLLTLVSIGTGFFLWWPRRVMRLRRRSSWRGVNFDLHQVLGLYSGAVLFLIALSGVAMYWNQTAGRVVRAVTASPTPPPAPGSTPPAEGAEPIDLEEAYRRAVATLPGADASFILVTDPRRALRIQMRFPEDRSGAGRSVVYLDRYSGEAVQVVSTRERDVATAILNERRAVHTGEILGIPTRAIAFLVSLALAAEVLSGLLIWWNRRGRR